MSLFPPAPLDPAPGASSRPLADRMRPRTLEDMIGQEALVGQGKPLRVQIESDQLGSLILWGPPGVGKTTLAEIIAHLTARRFVPFSAVTSGIKEIRQVMTEAESASHRGRRTILFVDEIHRFNKAQQDAFLPYVEKGTITLIGATTENPSFEVNSALLSRARVYVLEPLADDALVTLLQRAVDDRERGVLASPELAFCSITTEGDMLQRIAGMSDGDARVALNLLETMVRSTPPEAGVIRLTPPRLEEAAQRKLLLYDKGGEQHYNVISAFIKSMRNSDVDAALYWMARMLESGEDPLYVARRMVRFAGEDIGLADPRAIEQAMAARDAVHFIGRPEGDLALAQAAVYLALAPKSNALYKAYGAVQQDVQRTRAEPVPLHLRNAVTGLMRGLGYARGYQYAHDQPGSVADMPCLPEGLRDRVYYEPGAEGHERRVRERMQELADRRGARGQKGEKR
ncbi:MAG: replication-associated recombination protein A [Terriglobales bacterium]